MKLSVALCVACMLVSLPAVSVRAEDAKPNDMAERLKLSKELHDVRHIRDRINDSIMGYSKAIPAGDREDFIRYVSLKIDFDKLEQASIQYAAETYTVPEFKAMIAYFGSPDGQSAEAKGSEIYAPKIAKDIKKEIDAAIMAAKLGEGGSSAPNIPKNMFKK